MDNQNNYDDLLFEFVGNQLYLQEIEKYKSTRFIRKYTKQNLRNKEKEANLICDLCAAEFINVLMTTITDRQNEIIEILKQKYHTRFKSLLEQFTIAIHESGLVLPLPDGIKIFAGDFIEEYKLNGDTINDMLKHFEYCNYSVACSEMRSDDGLMEELRKVERQMFKEDLGISQGKEPNVIPFMDESIINMFTNELPQINK